MNILVLKLINGEEVLGEVESESETEFVLENPVGILSSRIGKPSQILQPWQFGHPESKKTCLWLKNLPVLKSTNILEKPKLIHNCLNYFL